GLPFIEPGTILHWEFSHFVVFERLTRDGVIVVDPASGRRELPMEAFGRAFTGVAIELQPGEDFATASAERRSTWRYVAPIIARRGLLGRVVATSARIQVLGLAVPALTKVLVDQVVPRSDRSLLLVLAGGMLVMSLFHLLSSWIRGRQLLYLRTQLDLHISRRFIEHLVA